MYLCVYLLTCLSLLHGSMGDTTVEPLTTSIRDQIRILTLQIKDQDVEIAGQNAKFSDFKALIAEQNTAIAIQNTQICKLESEIEKLINSPPAPPVTTTSSATPSILTTTSSTIGTSSGVVFTRWGRTDCPEDISTPVYNGTTGGSHYKHTGGAANRVCMPHDPIWNVHKHFNGLAWGYLYGSEYHGLPDSKLTNYNVPCAVCRASSYSTKIMIPGRTECYTGWDKAYDGELTSGYYKHVAATEYNCLDKELQTIGNNKFDGGVLFYPVRTVCGALPCPPYKNNTLLTCVVCLK